MGSAGFGCWLRADPGVAGKVGIVDCPKDVQHVWDLCLRAKDLSDGAFDPWAAKASLAWQVEHPPHLAVAPKAFLSH